MKTLQESLDLAVDNGKYNEDLGQHILDIADNVVRRNGLRYRYTEFEVDFIICPRIVDDMLVKCLSYDKTESSAKTFMSVIASSGMQSGIRAARAEKKGDYNDVFYYEDIAKKIENMPDPTPESLMDIDVIVEILKPKKDDH